MKISKVFPLLLLVCLTISAISAQDKAPAPLKAAKPAQGVKGMPGAPPMGGEVMAAHGKMMEEMQATKTQLDGGLAALKEAKGEAKTEAMVKLIETLAAQEKKNSKELMRIRMSMMGGMPGANGAMDPAKRAMDDAKASEEALDKLVEAMKTATGEAKTAAMEVVIEELVKQLKLKDMAIMRMNMMQMMRRSPMGGGMMGQGGPAPMHGGMPMRMPDTQTSGTTTHP